MKEKLSAGDIIQQLAERAGITKKLAAEVLRAIPEIVEEALNTDGEARVRGLGTFRLKTVASKKGRNPKTGEEVVIPPHQKLVFLPEESFRDQANEEFRYLEIKVLEEKVSGQQSTVGSQQSAVSSKQSAVSDEEPNAEYSTLNTGAKRHVNWLIPTLFGIVAILGVVFYFRNCSSVRGPRSAVSSQQSAVSSQDSGTWNSGNLEPDSVSGQQSAVSGKDSGTWNAGTLEPDPVSGQQSAVSGQDSGTWNAGTLEPNKQVPELKPQHSNLNANLPTTNAGTHLYQLAREVYGNPFLWVLIYRANLDKIKNPDQVVFGNQLTIPALEGTPKKLSRNDSIAVSDGYRLVYEYYLSKGDTRAEEFRLAMLKYKPD